jgi:hypothetical protein
MLHLALVAVLAVPTILFVGWVLNAINSRVQSVSQVSALTERVEFEVTQPGLAAVPVRQMRIATGDRALDGRCIDGLILPVLKANVIYGRVGYGPLSIRIVPPDTGPQSAISAEYEPDSHSGALALKGSTYIETDESCAQGSARKQPPANPLSSVPMPLPIWGKARVGSEFKGMKSPDPDPTLLLSGQITVSARALEIPPRFLGLRATLYPVTVLDLPVGSRLETYAPQKESPPPDDQQEKDGAGFVANWWGAVYVDSEKPALDVELATDTPKLALYRPNLGEPDIIEVTRLNQLFEDPNLIKAFKMLAALGTLIALCWWVLDAFPFAWLKDEESLPK